MEKLVCDICGGKIMIQGGGRLGECENCGANYSLERMRELVSGVEVSVTETQEDVIPWKTLLKAYMSALDFESVEQIVKEVLELSPLDEYTDGLYANLREWRYMEIKDGVLINYHGRASEIVIPDGVTCIGEDAFRGHEKLATVYIPNTVVTIGKGAFSGCSSLKVVVIPDGVTTVGSQAFAECSGLKSIILPDSVSTIGRFAFSGCDNLESIVIPDGITDIGEFAFAGCDKLISVTCPKGFEERLSGSKWEQERNKKRKAEREAREEAERSYWRQRGRCQRCGGRFEGIFTKTCGKCGKVKDY